MSGRLYSLSSAERTGFGIGLTGSVAEFRSSDDAVPYDIANRALPVVPGTMTINTDTGGAAMSGRVRSVWNEFAWTNAMVVASAPTLLTGNVLVCTLPKKTVIKNAYIVIDSAATVLTTLTVSLGRTGAAYEDLLAAADAKAVAGTLYGGAALERGALLGFDLPSLTATTAIYAQFIGTHATKKLADLLTCTGRVILETAALPL